MSINRYLEKIAESHTFSHVTSDDGLARILESGRIKTIRHLAKENPDLEVEVEPLPIPFIRQKLRAEDALSEMSGVKDVGKVFLTRNGYLPNYGDNVIVKRLSVPQRRTSLNTIPEEYVTGRAISVKNNAEVYVPDHRLEEWRKGFQGVVFKPKSELALKPYTIKDRVLNYPGKVLEALGFNKQASSPVNPRAIGSTAFIGGSEGLGLSIDNSDVDIFAPYARQRDYDKALERVKALYPTLQERSSTINNPNKSTLTGVVNGTEIDVVLGVGSKAINFRDAYQSAKQSLTDDQRELIKARKKELKESWILPELRYKLYKNNLATQLGLKQHYF